MNDLSVFLALFPSLISALSAAEWRSQSIYQVLTDRFARTDNSTTAACDTTQGEYCGGSWQGIINRLDYIKGMGFTAVSLFPFITPLCYATERTEVSQM
jgi:alpha-amylase